MYISFNIFGGIEATIKSTCDNGMPIGCSDEYRSVPVFELKVVGLEELELDGDALLGGELMELRGGGHTDPLGGREHRQLLLLDRPVLGVGQRLYTEYPG